MTDKIEMSLDDIIKANRSLNKNKRNIGPNRNRNQQKRSLPGIKSNKRSPGKILRDRNIRNLFTSKKPSNVGNRNQGDGEGKLLISNLDFGVSDSDIKELFSEIGLLKRSAIHYDKSGRSLGTADVIYFRKADALKAVKQYHGVPLDGRPMNIQLTTPNTSNLMSPNKPNKFNTKRRGPPNKRVGGGGGGVGGGNRPGQGQGQFRKNNVTAEELDAELDAYVNDMRLNV